MKNVIENMLTGWISDYFHILPCLAVYDDEDGFWVKAGWGKWFFGFIIWGK
jgi:hypothetical protein